MLRKTSLLLGCALVSNAVIAAPAYVVAPACLMENVHLQAATLATLSHYQLIKTNDDGIEQLALAKHTGQKPCGGFVNVTHAFTASTNALTLLTNTITTKYAPLHSDKKYEIKHQAEVNALLPQINPSNILTNLTAFSSYKDRFANSTTGVDATQFIQDRIQAYAKAANRNDIHITLIATPGYKQPSVIVKMGDSNTAGIVLGAHLDTLLARTSVKPGADDDGSGSMSLLEAARVIIESPLSFNKPIYFIWYAAEEEGLLGSQAVVSEFQQKNIPVDAVMHFDLTGYEYQNDPAMWVMDDYTNAALTTFTTQLIQTYVNVPVHHSECGYACSDHASWYNAGFATTLPAEASYENTNPAIHSSQDTMEKLSLNHMTNYTKVATAFAVELGDMRK